MDLVLLSVDGSSYNLSLSARQFDYSVFFRGDVIQFEGKKNFFGVYVRDVKVVKGAKGL